MVNVLLLRGWAREKRHWSDFPMTLERELGARKVFALDLPGAGTEYNRLCPLTLKEIVEDIRHRWVNLEDRDQKLPSVIVGVSLGGMIALQWSKQFANDFHGTVVINSSLSDFSKPWERLNTKQLKSLIETLREEDPVKRERQILSFTTFLPEEKIDSLAKEWAQYGIEKPVSRRNVLSQLWAAGRFRLGEVPKNPILILASRKDQLVNPKCSEAFSLKAGVPVIWHQSAGHDLTLEDPHWAAKRISRFARTLTFEKIGKNPELRAFETST